MNKNTLPILCSAAILGCSMVVSSCVDKSYDLSEINKNIHIGGDSLTLPSSSVDQIILKNVLDTTDVFCIVDGKYRVRQHGDIGIDPVSIDDITVGAPDIPVNEAKMNRQDASAARMRKAPGKSRYDFGFVVEENAVELEMEPTAVTTDVVGIERFACQPTELNMKISMGELNRYLKQMHTTGFVIEIPKGMDVTAVKLNGQALDMTAEMKQSLRDGTLLFPEGTSISTDNNELKIIIEGGTVAAKGQETAFVFDPAANTMKIDGKVAVKGELGFDAEDLQDKITSVEEVPGMADLSLHSAMTETKVKSISGTLQHDIDVPEVDDIKFDDIPDFLQDDDVVLDLKRPKIMLNVENNELPVEAVCDIRLTSYDAQGSAMHETKVSGVKILKDGKTQCAIVDVSDESENAGATQVVKGEIRKLINKIPDHIKADIENARIESQHVDDFDVTKHYEIAGTNYVVDSELELGPDFRIVYRDTLDGWKDDIKDFAVKKVVLNGVVNSTLPVDMNMSLTPIDESGKTLTQISVKDADVKANDKTPIQLEIEVQGNTPEDILRNFGELDGIILKATAKTGNVPSTALSPDDFITIDNVKISLVGGIYISTED